MGRPCNSGLHLGKKVGRVLPVGMTEHCAVIHEVFYHVYIFINYYHYYYSLLKKIPMLVNVTDINSTLAMYK